MPIIGYSLLGVLVVAQVAASPITFLSATRSVAIADSSAGQSYADSRTSSAFNTFNETLSNLLPGSASFGSQASALMADGIRSATQTTAFANGFAGDATAFAQTMLAVTFRISDPTNFTLAAARSASGLGVPYSTFQMTNDVGSTVFDWGNRFSGANITFTEDLYGLNVSAGGLLLPGDYSLLISQNLFFTRPAGSGYDGGSQGLGMELRVTAIPDTGVTAGIFGATLVGILAVNEQRRRSRVVGKLF